MDKKLLIPFLLLCSGPLLSAQEEPKVVRFAREQLSRFTQPSRHFDTTYVVQPRMLWSIAWENTLIRTGVGLTSEVTVTDFGDTPASPVHATLESRLQRRLYKKVGGIVSYGGLRLAYGREADKRNPGRNTFSSLSLTRPSFGVQVQYYKISEYVEGSLSVDGVSTPTPFLSAEPALMRDMSIDLYYLFNHRRFSYTSTALGRTLQRRSAGSWMLASRFMQGEVAMDEADLFFPDMTVGLSRYTSQQASFGAGYSFNWVPLHRDPVEEASGKGLRNLTVNATLLPMASLYNHVMTETVSKENPEGEMTRYNGTLAFAMSARLGLGFSWDRYFLSATAGYNRFGFTGKTNTLWLENGTQRFDIDTRGLFHDLTARIQFCVKF